MFERVFRSVLYLKISPYRRKIIEKLGQIRERYLAITCDEYNTTTESVLDHKTIIVTAKKPKNKHLKTIFQTRLSLRTSKYTEKTLEEFMENFY